jgi:hypothetical protein
LIRVIFGVCSAVMGIGMATLPKETILTIHLFGAPAVTYVFAYIYFKRFNYTKPFQTALFFLAVQQRLHKPVDVEDEHFAHTAGKVRVALDFIRPSHRRKVPILYVLVRVNIPQPAGAENHEMLVGGERP